MKEGKGSQSGGVGLDSVHNPDRYMADLRQILSQGRKRIGLLVGAGAPLSIRVDSEGHLKTDGHPLIPGVDELTALVVKGLENTRHRAAAEAIRKELGAKSNIESILSRVRLLERALGKVTVHELDGGDYSLLGANICERIGKIVSAKLPPERNAFNELVAWIGGTLRTHPIEIFTTNYDLLLEESFEAARVPYFDGFTGGSAPFFDPVTVASNDLPPRWSRVWKLHGSLGWRSEGGMLIRSGQRKDSELIYPDHLKYDLTQKQPYSALFERLKQFLLTPDSLLLVAGFSFRDSHVCAVLDEALAMNSNAAVLAFQFCSLSAEAEASKMAFDRPNLSVYASDGAIINGIGGSWRPGELAENWEEIRASFWAHGTSDSPPKFLLGDFAYFARFCALAQAVDLQRPKEIPAVDLPEVDKVVP
jgi:hypothetical protein